MITSRREPRMKCHENAGRGLRAILTLAAISVASFARADSTVLVSTSGTSASLSGAVKSFAVTASGSTWTQQANFNSDAWTNVSATGQATGLTQDIYGNVYVGVVSGTNASNGIRIYRQTGGASVGYLSNTWGSGNLTGNGPDGLALGANGSLYATIAFGSGNNKLLTFDTTTLSAGQIQTSQTGADTGLSGLSTPRGLAVASDGNLYIASRNNNQVLRYSGSGTSATQISTTFTNPQGVAWDARNDRLVVSTNATSGTAVVGTLTLSGSANRTAIAASVGGSGGMAQPVEATTAITRYDTVSFGALLIPGATPANLSTVASLPGPSYMLVVRDTRLWSGGSGNWGSGTTWAQGIGGTTGSAVFTSGSGATSLPSILTFTGNGGTATNDVGGTPFVGGINFAPGAGSYTLSGNAFTLGLNANIRNLTTTGTQTIATDVAALGSQWIYTEAGSTLAMSGAVSGVGTHLTTVGAGVLTFSGNNSYSGGTTITAGTLRVGAGGTSGSLGSGGVVNNGALVFNRSDNYGGAFSNAISGTGGLTLAGGTLTLSGSNTASGQTTVVAGRLQFAKTAALYGGTTANWTSSNIVSGSGATIAFNVGGSDEFSTSNITTLLTNLASSTSTTNGMNAGSALGFDTTNAAGGTFTISDAIGNTTGASGGARGLVKLGAGTLVLGGSNAFSGATSIDTGTISFANENAFNATSGISIAGGAGLRYTGAADTFGRNITVTSGTGTVTNSGGGTLTLSGGLSKNGTVLRLSGGTFNVTGLITGTIANSDLVVAGTSTVTLSNTNTYNGPTFVNESSTLVLGTNNAIPNNSVVTLGNATTTGTLNMNGFTNAIGGLGFGSSGGTLRLAATSTSAAPLTSPSGTMTLTNGTLDLAGSGSTAGIYRVLSAQTVSGTFSSITGTSAAYQVLTTASSVDYQQRAVLGAVTVTNPAVSIITGGSAAFTYTVANNALSGGAELGFSSGSLSNLAGSSSGTAAAGGTSGAISGLVFTGSSIGAGQQGTFTVMAPAAFNATTATGTVSVNVLNHSLASFQSSDSAALTLNLGTYDATASAWTSGSGSLGFSVWNIASDGFLAADTAGLALYDVIFTSGTNIFSTGLSNFANLGAGLSNGYTGSVLSPGSIAQGTYQGVYKLKFRDQQDLSGAINTRDLTLTMSVVVVPEPATLAMAGIGIAAAAWGLRRRQPPA